MELVELQQSTAECGDDDASRGQHDSSHGDDCTSAAVSFKKNILHRYREYCSRLIALSECKPILTYANFVATFSASVRYIVCLGFRLITCSGVPMNEHLATIMVATGRLAAAAQIGLSYSPSGVNMHHHLIHGSLDPNPHSLSYESVSLICQLDKTGG